MLRSFLIGFAAAIVVALLAAWQRTTPPDDKGWRSVKVGAMHHVGLWLGTAWSVLRTRANALRWRGQRIRFRRKGVPQERMLDDVLAVRRSALGWTRIVFDEGLVVKIDPHAQGAEQLLDLLERSSPDPG